MKRGNGTKQKDGETKRQRMEKQALSGELDAEETWRLLNEGLREYEEAEARKPPPPPTKAPAWMDDCGSDDDNIGGRGQTPPGTPPPPVANSAISAAESRLEMSWKMAAQLDAQRIQNQKDEQEKEAKKKKAAEDLKRQEEIMEREVELAIQQEEENKRKREARVRKHKERAEAEMQKKREERLRAAEEELKKRRKEEVVQRKQRKVDNEAKWKEEEILQGFHGPEAKAKLEAELRSREEREKKAKDEAREVRKQLENLRKFSAAAAKAFEEQNKEALAKADKVLKKEDERMREIQQKRELAALRQQVSEKDRLKKQAENRAKQRALVEEQLRLAEEARKKAEAEGVVPVSAEEVEAAAPPKLGWEAAPPSGWRRLVADVCRLRNFFQKFPTLPDLTDQQADHAGQMCILEQEATTDGGQAVVKLRFEKGFIGWFPRLCLEGEAWWELGENFLCDACGELCMKAGTLRPRVCGSQEKVFAMYMEHYNSGVLPQWNARNVPNPRRQFCAGQECEIEEEDMQNKKIKLRFDDGFISWFPRGVVQGSITHDLKMAKKAKRAMQKKVDPYGYSECVPETLKPQDNPNFQVGFKPKAAADVAAAVPPLGGAPAAGGEPDSCEA
eukprot:TRINITY_DN1476_c0_g2_i1.p1 TRINITY_DN1476_c0_g2~~TRINITY_DN1476_c0_g2_i1.p1  ORF type:complete len:649 (+),score=293.39 TRINITY_DN1476_c0_g2_i1:94-1947(+)